MITLGGDAELELVDSLDPFSEGVVFSVRPPKKSWKNIANLSGGEKVISRIHWLCCSIWPLMLRPYNVVWFCCIQTLSSLALVFALHHYKPTPLYVMDEIDAALGTSNWIDELYFFECHLFSKILYYVSPLFGSYAVADFKNVSIVGHYVKDRTKDAQFIIIR